MSFLDALVSDPFMVNEQLVDSLLQEPDSSEVWLAMRADGQRGSGTVTDPYDASSPTLFSTLMNSFPPRTVIHLGPGVFQTFGFAPAFPPPAPQPPSPWQPKSGQKIIGAGMYATTLKVVGANSQTFLTLAIL